MRTEENKALLRRLVEEGLHRKNLGIMDELIAPDFVNHSAPLGIPPTREGYRQYVEVLLASFPDIHLAIEDLIAEGDKVVVRYTVTGSHQALSWDFHRPVSGSHLLASVSSASSTGSLSSAGNRRIP